MNIMPCHDFHCHILAISIPVAFCNIFATDGLCAECDIGYYLDELSHRCACKSNIRLVH